MQTADPLLVDCKTTCRLLSIGKTALYAMHNNGKLGPLPVHCCGKILYRRQELEAWVAAGCPPRTRWLAGGTRNAD
jgi:hypothetical protein